MSIVINGWQAFVVSVVVTFVFVWAGYATSKLFAFLERDERQKKYIHSLEMLVRQKESKK